MISIKIVSISLAVIAGVVLFVSLLAAAIHNSTIPACTCNKESVTVELLPGGRVNIAYAAIKVSFTSREFNKLQLELKACFEHRERCKFVSSSVSGCAYTAHVCNMHLCANTYKQVINATVGGITLHREDLLRIYEV